MAIDLKGKTIIDGPFLRQLEAYGWCHVNGVPTSRNDAACQALIDAYDPLPEYKDAKIAAIKVEGLTRIQAIMPAIATFDMLELIREIWMSIAPGSRQPSAKLTSVINTYTAGRNAIESVKAATTTAQVDAVTPAWP
jgi:hypothetical protein